MALEDELEHRQQEIVEEEKKLGMIRLGLAVELNLAAETVFSLERRLERQAWRGS